MIRFEVEFLDKAKFDNLIRYIENNLVYGELQEEMINLATHNVEFMREIIASSKKRPSLGSNLEDSIEATVLKSIGGIEIGIGNIFHLKAKAPYWEVLDQGGYVPYSTRKGAPVGSFDGDKPISGGAGQNWERSGAEGYFMKPSKAIEGIEYVAKTVKNLDRELKETIERLGSKFFDGLSNI